MKDSSPPNNTAVEAEMTQEQMVQHRNALALGVEMKWVEELIKVRAKNWELEPQQLPGPPDLPESSYLDLLIQQNVDLEKRCLIAFSLAPYLAPEVFDPFRIPNPETRKVFTEYGGLNFHTGNSFWPTLRTVTFILSGQNIYHRILLRNLYHTDTSLSRAGVWLAENREHAEGNLSVTMKGDPALQVDPDLLKLLVEGKVVKPAFSRSFPAHELTTPQEWKDLVLNPITMGRVNELKDWLAYEKVIMEDWGMKDKLRPGYRVLFHGKPGTGKTFTANLLGKALKRPVFRIDLSAVVSKYIGETEQNLSRIFQKAEGKGWILFFDEADALFGKRAETKSAHDRYANQEVSFLLQRIENFQGLVILATNFKKNMDEAFMRRFEKVIYFPMPGANERLQLWQNAFSPQIAFAPDIDWLRLSAEFEVSGGVIMNVVRYALLQSAKREDRRVKSTDVIQGMKLEFEKEGKKIKR